MHSNEELAARECDVEGERLVEEASVAMFVIIRKTTIAFLIGSSTLLAFTGILVVWNIIGDNNDAVLQKVIASISSIVFFTIITIIAKKKFIPFLSSILLGTLIDLIIKH